jgi:hypothetical protein
MSLPRSDDWTPTDSAADYSATAWLNPAARAQLERDLDDLPELWDQLDANREHLLARGDRNPDDPPMRYPINTNVFDLLRPHRPNPGTNAADLAEHDRLAAARRLGVHQTLQTWVVTIEADMLDAEAEHRQPWIPGTITHYTGWLRAHLDWIGARPEIQELAHQLRTIVTDLERAVGPAYASPDNNATGTITQLAATTNIPASTLYRWAAAGWLQPLQPGERIYSRRDALQLRHARRP